MSWLDEEVLEYPIAVIILSVGAVFCFCLQRHTTTKNNYIHSNNACTLKILGPWYFAVLDIHDLTCIHSPSRSFISRDIPFLRQVLDYHIHDLTCTRIHSTSRDIPFLRPGILLPVRTNSMIVTRTIYFHLDSKF